MTAKDYFDYLKDRIEDVRKVAKLGTFVTFAGICPILERLAWTSEYDDISNPKANPKGQIGSKHTKAFIKRYLFQTNNKYRSNTKAEELYSYLRCAVLHCLSLYPDINGLQSKFALAHRRDKEILNQTTGHLEVYKGKVILVAEDLLDELENALLKMWNDPSVKKNFAKCANSLPPIGHEFYESSNSPYCIVCPSIPAVSGVY